MLTAVQFSPKLWSKTVRSLSQVNTSLSRDAGLPSPSANPSYLPRPSSGGSQVQGPVPLTGPNVPNTELFQNWGSPRLLCVERSWCPCSLEGHPSVKSCTRAQCWPHSRTGNFKIPFHSATNYFSPVAPSSQVPRGSDCGGQVREWV